MGNMKWFVWTVANCRLCLTEFGILLVAVSCPKAQGGKFRVHPGNSLVIRQGHVGFFIAQGPNEVRRQVIDDNNDDNNSYYDIVVVVDRRCEFGRLPLCIYEFIVLFIVIIIMILLIPFSCWLLLLLLLLLLFSDSDSNSALFFLSSFLSFSLFFLFFFFLPPLSSSSPSLFSCFCNIDINNAM